LDLLEATRLDKGALGLELSGEDLGKLGANVSEDIVGGKLKEGFKSGHVGAHLDNVLKSLLGFILKVLRRVLEHVDGKETCWHISLSQKLAVLGGVATDLTECPCGGSLQVILRLVDKSILKRGNTFGDNNGHGEGVIESRNVTEGHDTWKSAVTLGLTDVVNGSGSTTGVNDELGEFSSLLGNLTNASGGILADLNINVLEAVKNSGEDFSLNNDLSKIDGVLSDLSKALADVSLELGIRVGDEGSEVWDGTLVNNSLGELLGMFSDF